MLRSKVASATSSESPIASPASGANLAENPKAKAWLTLMDELIKADMEQNALEEWEKFHKAYSDYFVPEKLDAKIKALKNNRFSP